MNDAGMDILDRIMQDRKDSMAKCAVHEDGQAAHFTDELVFQSPTESLQRMLLGVTEETEWGPPFILMVHAAIKVVEPFETLCLKRIEELECENSLLLSELGRL